MNLNDVVKSKSDLRTMLRDLVSEKQLQLSELKRKQINDVNEIIKSKSMEIELSKQPIQFKWDEPQREVSEGLTTEYNGKRYHFGFNLPNSFRDCDFTELVVKPIDDNNYHFDRNIPSLSGNNKIEDFNSITDWYSVKEVVSDLISSKPFINLYNRVIDIQNQIDLINIEISSHENQISSLINNEVNNEINYIIEYGGEVEILSHIDCDRNYEYCEDTNDYEYIYSLQSKREVFFIKCKIEDEVYEFNVSKIIIGDKVKGGKSFECELWSDDYQTGELKQIFTDSIILITKNNLVELLEKMIVYNKTTDFIELKNKSIKEIEYYKEKGFRVMETNEEC